MLVCLDFVPVFEKADDKSVQQRAGVAGADIQLGAGLRLQSV